jgi:hypothetical protein
MHRRFAGCLFNAQNNEAITLLRLISEIKLHIMLSVKLGIR